MAPVTQDAPKTGNLLTGAETLDWDGNEVVYDDSTYEEYLNSRPPKEDLQRYRTPVYYWEVKYPGCTLQPYPTMGGFQSTNTGLWELWNKAQEDEVRRHIALTVNVDPDELKLTADDIKIMTGKKKSPLRFCQDCFFVTSSLVAADLHESEEVCGHTTKSQPRKDN